MGRILGLEKTSAPQFPPYISLFDPLSFSALLRRSPSRFILSQPAPEMAGKSPSELCRDSFILFKQPTCEN